MGGCRCVYRKCQNSTAQSPDLHYFHFPVRDPVRCEQWITNARKPSFRTLDKNRLRNKVICSLHFEEKCFINENHDRLIHNAVPTLGFEEDEEEDKTNVIQNMLLPSVATDNADIMLIPLNEDNTKFTFPDIGFSGMSYTICDDNLIPSIRTEYSVDKSDTKDPAAKTLNVKPVIKRVKPFKQTSFASNQLTDLAKMKTASQKLFLKSVIPPLHKEPEIANGKKISSYSVSTLNGDLSLEPSNEYHIINEPLQMSTSDYQTNNASNLSESNTPLLDNDISLQFKSDNEYTIAVTPITMNERLVRNENINHDDTSQDSTTKNSNQSNADMCEESAHTNNNKSKFIETPEKEYIRMIKSNSKQIKQLKRVVQKQNKINQFILQRKRMPHFKPRNLSKSCLLDLLKQHLQPSLLAILKLELLPVEDVVLSDSEEKFITDLYTENPECYNLLRNKWKWNLPSSDKGDESMN